LKELLNTGEAELIEDSPVDNYWGIGSDDKWLNNLGKLLRGSSKKLDRN